MRPISRFVYCDKSTGNNFDSITQSNKANNTDSSVFFIFSFNSSFIPSAAIDSKDRHNCRTRVATFYYLFRWMFGSAFNRLSYCSIDSGIYSVGKMLENRDWFMWHQLQFAKEKHTCNLISPLFMREQQNRREKKKNKSCNTLCKLFWHRSKQMSTLVPDP